MTASWWSPATDAGVFVQVAVTVVIGAAFGWLVRGERSVLLLVIGVTMVAVGWYGMRALH